MSHSLQLLIAVTCGLLIATGIVSMAVLFWLKGFLTEAYRSVARIDAVLQSMNARERDKIIGR